MNSVRSFFRNCFVRAAVAVFVVLLIVSAAASFKRIHSNRRIFLFPTGSGRAVREIRYLPKNPVQGDVRCYVDELVLGSLYHRGKKLFSYGTKIEFCFLDDDCLYVGLSENAVLQLADSVRIDEAKALLKKNIQKNFKNIEEINLFINGNYIPG